MRAQPQFLKLSIASVQFLAELSAASSLFTYPSNAALLAPTLSLWDFTYSICNELIPNPFKGDDARLSIRYQHWIGRRAPGLRPGDKIGGTLGKSLFFQTNCSNVPTNCTASRKYMRCIRSYEDDSLQGPKKRKSIYHTPTRMHVIAFFGDGGLSGSVPPILSPGLGPRR